MPLFDSLKRGASRAAFEADKLMRINRAEAAIGSLKAQMSAKTTTLGERTLELYKQGVPLPQTLVELCDAVLALKDEKDEKELELQRIRNETFQPARAGPAQAFSGGLLSLPGFNILEQVGEGGMGVVYRAHQLSVNRTVAIKVLPEHLGKDRSFVERFRRGAEAAARLTHPNVALIYDFRHDSGQYYIVMEFVGGGTLRHLLASKGHLPMGQAVEIASQVARALAAAYGAGIVHRDIKPENIMITPQGLVKVTDFGIAKLAGASTATMDGSIIGSAYYMAPEQARGDKSIDGRADIYSLGAVMYEMVTGVPPFQGETILVVISRHLNPEDRPIPPERLNPQVPPWLNRAILRALEKDREKRILSAEELSRLLATNGDISPSGPGELTRGPSAAPDKGEETIVRPPGPQA